MTANATCFCFRIDFTQPLTCIASADGAGGLDRSWRMVGGREAAEERKRRASIVRRVSSQGSALSASCRAKVWLQNRKVVCLARQGPPGRSGSSV